MSHSHSGVLQHPCPVTRCQPPWGRGAGVIHGRDSGLTNPADRGAHGLPAAATRANCEADAGGFLHTSSLSSLWLHLAVWQAGPGFLWAWGMVATEFGPAASPGHFCLFVGKVQFSMKFAVCFWSGSPCHLTFRSSATWPALGMETFLTQGLGTNREVVHRGRKAPYRCGLPLINEMTD